MELKTLKEFYRKKLERKERLIKEYTEEKNSIYGFNSIKRELEYNILYAEIEIIKTFIEDLNSL